MIPGRDKRIPAQGHLLNSLVSPAVLLLCISSILLVAAGCNFGTDRLSTGQFTYRFNTNRTITITDTLLFPSGNDTLQAFRTQPAEGGDLLFLWQRRKSRTDGNADRTETATLLFQLPDTVEELSADNGSLRSLNMLLMPRCNCPEDDAGFPVSRGTFLADKLSETVWLIELAVSVDLPDETANVKIDHIFVFSPDPVLQ